MRPVCHGVTTPASTPFVGDAASVAVFGCATGVLVTCDAGLGAAYPARFLVSGDSIRVSSPLPITTGTLAACTIRSDQGATTFTVEQP